MPCADFPALSLLGKREQTNPNLVKMAMHGQKAHSPFNFLCKLNKCMAASEGP